jgi:hypothetical protein
MMKYWILRTSREFRLMDWLRDFNWLSDDQLADGWKIDTGSVEPESGDFIFFWYEDTPETRGIIAQGKTTILPEVFPSADRKPGYFTDKEQARQTTGGRQIAVKYIRLCLAQPVTKNELTVGKATGKVLSLPEQKRRLTAIPKAAGKHIEALLRSRTTMIDLTYCET